MSALGVSRSSRPVHGCTAGWADSRSLSLAPALRLGVGTGGLGVGTGGTGSTASISSGVSDPENTTPRHGSTSSSWGSKMGVASASAAGGAAWVGRGRPHSSSPPEDSDVRGSGRFRRWCGRSWRGSRGRSSRHVILRPDIALGRRADRAAHGRRSAIQTATGVRVPALLADILPAVETEVEDACEPLHRRRRHGSHQSLTYRSAAVDGRLPKSPNLALLASGGLGSGAVRV